MENIFGKLCKHTISSFSQILILYFSSLWLSHLSISGDLCTMCRYFAFLETLTHSIQLYLYTDSLGWDRLLWTHWLELKQACKRSFKALPIFTVGDTMDRWNTQEYKQDNFVATPPRPQSRWARRQGETDMRCVTGCSLSCHQKNTRQ